MLHLNPLNQPQVVAPFSLSTSSTAGDPKRTISPISITPISSVNNRRSANGSSSQLIGLSSTPGNSNIQLSGKSGFNRDSSEKDTRSYNNDGKADSLANSRGGDSRSKRKIFVKNSGDDLDSIPNNSMMEEMLKVTDISRYLYSDVTRNPEYDKFASVLKL